MVFHDVDSCIRERLASGALPREKCLVTWFGPGSGAPCAACDRPILASEIECECEHPADGLLRLHQACFSAWDRLRQA